MNLTPRQAEAIVRLRETDDFRHFMEYLGSTAEELTKKLVFGDADKLFLAQGMTRSVITILDTIIKAEPPKQDRTP